MWAWLLSLAGLARRALGWVVVSRPSPAIRLGGITPQPDPPTSSQPVTATHPVPAPVENPDPGNGWSRLPLLDNWAVRRSSAGHGWSWTAPSGDRPATTQHQTAAESAGTAQPNAHPTAAQPNAHPTTAQPNAHPTTAQPDTHHTTAQRGGHHRTTQPEAHQTTAQPGARHRTTRPDMHHIAAQPTTAARPAAVWQGTDGHNPEQLPPTDLPTTATAAPTAPRAMAATAETAAAGGQNAMADAVTATTEMAATPPHGRGPEAANPRPPMPDMGIWPALPPHDSSPQATGRLSRVTTERLASGEWTTAPHSPWSPNRPGADTAQWPELLDDSELWTPSAGLADDTRNRRLDREQEGGPWSA
jgi:hypothetical protein